MDMELDNIYYENYTKWKASKIKNKKVWNFPYFSKPTHPWESMKITKQSQTKLSKADQVY